MVSEAKQIGEVGVATGELFDSHRSREIEASSECDC
jgi:hypothetical protein